MRDILVTLPCRRNRDRTAVLQPVHSVDGSGALNQTAINKAIYRMTSVTEDPEITYADIGMD